jgi:hypothetical protein
MDHILVNDGLTRVESVSTLLTLVQRACAKTRPESLVLFTRRRRYIRCQHFLNVAVRLVHISLRCGRLVSAFTGQVTGSGRFPLRKKSVGAVATRMTYMYMTSLGRCAVQMQGTDAVVVNRLFSPRLLDRSLLSYSLSRIMDMMMPLGWYSTHRRWDRAREFHPVQLGANVRVFETGSILYDVSFVFKGPIGFQHVRQVLRVPCDIVQRVLFQPVPHVYSSIQIFLDFLFGSKLA